MLKKLAASVADDPTDNKRTEKQWTKCQRFVKLKEVQANAQSQRFCTTFNFTPTHPSPPTSQNN